MGGWELGGAWGVNAVAGRAPDLADLFVQTALDRLDPRHPSLVRIGGMRAIGLCVPGPLRARPPARVPHPQP